MGGGQMWSISVWKWLNYRFFYIPFRLLRPIIPVWVLFITGNTCCLPLTLALLAQYTTATLCIFVCVFLDLFWLWIKCLSALSSSPLKVILTNSPALFTAQQVYRTIFSITHPNHHTLLIPLSEHEISSHPLHGRWRDAENEKKNN